jgi:isopentenyl diphosphate isomerase/L-lactate dehydrogenase-like FMN-dependent dehydrogenase
VTTGIPRHANNPPAAANAHGMTLRSAEGKVGWDDFAWLRDTWPGKLVIKGIQRADDAIRAVDLGADAVVVSNHGGRNMDSAVATIDVLPDIAAAVGDRTTVLIDSGVRRGSDIVKALALGADAVLLGRPAVWAVAAGGEAGVGRLLGLLRRELELTLSHVGSRGPADIGADIFAGTGPARPPRPADRSRPIATLAATAGKEGNP